MFTEKVNGVVIFFFKFSSSVVMRVRAPGLFKRPLSSFVPDFGFRKCFLNALASLCAGANGAKARVAAA